MGPVLQDPGDLKAQEGSKEISVLVEGKGTKDLEQLLKEESNSNTV